MSTSEEVFLMDLSERIKRMPKDVKITVIAIFSILIIATIVISVVFVTSRYNASSMRGIKVEGAVSVEDSNGNVKSVSKNTKFQSGDSLETGSNGIATVGLDSDKNVTMEPNSRADFVKMNNQLSMKLIRGGVFFEVTEKLKQDESFEIKTSSMTAGIKGASGYIYYDINSRDNIIVTDGVVIVSATNPSSGETKYAEVHGGQSVSVRLYGDRKTDTVVFDVKDITKEELPLIAVEAIAADGALLSRVSQSTGWDKEELSTYVNAIMTGAVSIQTEVTKSSEAVEVQTPDPETDPTETTETITEETTETSAAATATPTPEPSGGNTGTVDKFAKEKEWKAREEATNRIEYATGEKNYLEYTKRMLEIEVEFNKKKVEHTDLSAEERLAIEAAYYEAIQKQKEEADKQTIEDVVAAYNEQVAQEKQRYIDGLVSYEVYQEALEQLEIDHLNKMASLYAKGSKEQLQTQRQLQDKLVQNQRRHQKETEDAEKKHQEELARMKEKYFGDNPAERKAKYDADLALLTEVYNREILAAANNAKEKLRIEKAYQKARIALMEQYNIEGAETNKNFFVQWNEDVMDFLESDFGQAVQGTLDTLVSGMSSIFQQLTTIVQAELEIQTAGIEKKYDREISLAEGNNYKVKRLEKQKEKEIAKAKNEANKKMFAMQVIQAVAQTATNAINAYGSAAAIPVVGFVMAPIAAAMAVAAGMLQIAAIKKQQQASEAQGYASGGFTGIGGKYEVAGVVHKGEWVASQEMVNNPATRPIIEALDQAQRTNTIGQLSADDVSRTITAPRVLADNAINSRNVPQQVIVQNDNSGQTSEALSEYALTMRLLKDRLDEPFLTVNSVTGETGMKQAQDEYDKLIRNKTPKSRRT